MIRKSFMSFILFVLLLAGCCRGDHSRYQIVEGRFLLDKQSGKTWKYVSNRGKNPVWKPIRKIRLPRDLFKK